MSLKGLAYPKTSWSYQERPVPSTKLNTWDDRIDTAFELFALWLNHLAGGADGVLRIGSGDGLRVTAFATPGLSVEVQPGHAFIAQCPFKLAALTATALVTPPVTFPRIDLVQASLSAWTITLKSGTEASSPIAPLADADCLVLAEIHLRPGMSSIKQTDDTLNGYIIDTRSFL